jgi:hypothetical protein
VFVRKENNVFTMKQPSLKERNGKKWVRLTPGLFYNLTFWQQIGSIVKWDDILSQLSLLGKCRRNHIVF